MIIKWFIDNYIELLGLIFSLIYLYFSIKEKILLWLFGILSALFYIYIYYFAKFYADMTLQFYYLFISAYGWIRWKRKNDQQQNIKIRRSQIKEWIIMSFITTAIFFAIAYLLDNYTDSPLPYWDSLTTSLSLAATWMLVHKQLEHWIIWIFVDICSAVLYFYRELYLTTFLFIVYTIFAVFGFIAWQKKYKNIYENKI